MTVLSPEIDAYKYGQLIFDRGARAINGKGLPFQQMVPEKLDFYTQKY